MLYAISISLSQIDPDPEIFDVLIVDEASQMKIEDAIGSILRAKQVIIVGDPMQLPPTNFLTHQQNLIQMMELLMMMSLFLILLFQNFHQEC